MTNTKKIYNILQLECTDISIIIKQVASTLPLSTLLLDIVSNLRYNKNIILEGGILVSYRFRVAREKAGLSAAEVARRIGVSQPAVNQWDSGAKIPSVEMLCKLADLYCVSTDYLLGRDGQVDTIPRTDDIIPVQTLRTLNGKPV